MTKYNTGRVPIVYFPAPLFPKILKGKPLFKSEMIFLMYEFYESFNFLHCGLEIVLFFSLIIKVYDIALNLYKSIDYRKLI